MKKDALNFKKEVIQPKKTSALENLRRKGRQAIFTLILGASTAFGTAAMAEKPNNNTKIEQKESKSNVNPYLLYLLTLMGGATIGGGAMAFKAKRDQEELLEQKDREYKQFLNSNHYIGKEELANLNSILNTRIGKFDHIQDINNFMVNENGDIRGGLTVIHYLLERLSTTLKETREVAMKEWREKEEIRASRTDVKQERNQLKLDLESAEQVNNQLELENQELKTELEKRDAYAVILEKITGGEMRTEMLSAFSEHLKTVINSEKFNELATQAIIMAIQNEFEEIQGLKNQMATISSDLQGMISSTDADNLGLVHLLDSVRQISAQLTRRGEALNAVSEQITDKLTQISNGSESLSTILDEINQNSEDLPAHMNLLVRLLEEVQQALNDKKEEISNISHSSSLFPSAPNETLSEPRHQSPIKNLKTQVRQTPYTITDPQDLMPPSDESNPSSDYDIQFGSASMLPMVTGQETPQETYLQKGLIEQKTSKEDLQDLLQTFEQTSEYQKIKTEDPNGLALLTPPPVPAHSGDTLQDYNPQKPVNASDQVNGAHTLSSHVQGQPVEASHFEEEEVELDPGEVSAGTWARNLLKNLDGPIERKSNASSPHSEESESASDLEDLWENTNDPQKPKDGLEEVQVDPASENSGAYGALRLKNLTAQDREKFRDPNTQDQTELPPNHTKPHDTFNAERIPSFLARNTQAKFKG